MKIMPMCREMESIAVKFRVSTVPFRIYTIEKSVAKTRNR